jgi:hypothetical protein
LIEKNIEYRIYKDKPIFIGQTYEKMKGEDLYIKTLRIMEPFLDCRMAKEILVESLPFEIMGNKLPSFLHFQNFIYYFKRIYSGKMKEMNNK